VDGRIPEWRDGETVIIWVKYQDRKPRWKKASLYFLPHGWLSLISIVEIMKISFSANMSCGFVTPADK